MEAPRGLGELGRDPEAVAGLADTAFEDGLDTQPAADLAGLDRRAAEQERGRPRRDAKPAQAAQGVDDLFGDALAEVGLVLVPAHVGERQDRDRRDLPDAGRGRFLSELLELVAKARGGRDPETDVLFQAAAEDAVELAGEPGIELEGRPGLALEDRGQGLGGRLACRTDARRSPARKG